MRFYRKRTVEQEWKGALLASDMAEIRITKILLGQDKIWVESCRRPKFVNGAPPVVMKSIRVAKIIVCPSFVGRFNNHVGPE